MVDWQSEQSLTKKSTALSLNLFILERISNSTSPTSFISSVLSEDVKVQTVTNKYLGQSQSFGRSESGFVPSSKSNNN
jgi:hypothetical protein